MPADASRATREIRKYRYVCIKIRKITIRRFWKSLMKNSPLFAFFNSLSFKLQTYTFVFLFQPRYSLWLTGDFYVLKQHSSPKCIFSADKHVTSHEKYQHWYFANFNRTETIENSKFSKKFCVICTARRDFFFFCNHTFIAFFVTAIVVVKEWKLYLYNNAYGFRLDIMTTQTGIAAVSELLNAGDGYARRNPCISSDKLTAN